MSLIPATTTVEHLTGTLAACGIPAPDSARHWLEVRDQLAADMNARTITDPRDTLDSLTADNIAATIDRLTRERMEATERQRITHEMIEAVAGNALRAIRSEGDRIIATARKGFDKAAKVLSANAGKYAPGEPAESLLSRGPDIASAWAVIRETAPALDRYLDLWTALYGRPASADTIAATYDGDHWRRVDAQAAFDSADRWHNLATQGVLLRLNTYAETLKLEAETPAKELRAQHVNSNGFRGVAQVRG